MKSLALRLSEARQHQELVLREVAAATGIDQALIHKFEKGERLPSQSQVPVLARALKIDFAELQKLWLAEKVWQVVRYEPHAMPALQLAESRVEYLSSSKTFEVPEISTELTQMLETVDKLMQRWQARKPENPVQMAKLKEAFDIEYTFESNRIEGNTLTLQETHLVVNEGLTIGGKSMTEHLEAINHAEAVQFIDHLAAGREEVNRRSLLELHYLILKGIDRTNAGQFRTVPVRISGSKHEPPQPYLLEKLMEDYFIHYKQQKRLMHPVILAAEMHERLVSVHPFVDGNGRTSRLVMNLILLSNGYTIANLKGDSASRLAYYRALEKVQVDNAPEEFYALVAGAVEASLTEHLAMT